MSTPQVIAAVITAIGAVGYFAVALLAGTGRVPSTITLPLRGHAIAQIAGIAGWIALLAWGGFWS